MGEAARLYNDPTFDAVARMEAEEKRCRVCMNRRELSTGAVLCGTGKRWPFCKGQANGFQAEGEQVCRR